MKSRADVVVVGGGIIGSCTAVELAGRGAGRVRLLEKRFPGAGSTGKSGAILRQHYSHETTVRMARRSLQHYAEFEQRFGRDIGFRRPGMLFLVPASNRSALEQNIALQQRLGVEVSLLEVEQIRRLERRIEVDDDLLAAWEPEAAYVNPVRTVGAMASLAAEQGVNVSCDCGIESVEVETGGSLLIETSGGEKISAGRVVLCAGPWTQSILQRLGLEYPLQAVRPEQAYLEPPSDFGGQTAIYADLTTGVYWKPEDAGWTRIGKLSFEEDDPVADPDFYDEGVSHKFIEFSRSAISRRLPRFRESVSWGGCGALYTVTPDSHPLIGAVPEVEGLFLASGFSGHGFKMGPAVGAGLAGLMTGTDPGPLDPDLFAVDRLRHDRPVTVPYEYGILG